MAVLSFTNAVLATRTHELRLVAAQVQHLDGLCVYVARAIDIMRSKWTDAFRPVMKKFEALSALLEDAQYPAATSEQELLVFAVTGVPSAPVREFVSEYLSPQPLARLRNGVDQALAYLSDMAQHLVVPALMQWLRRLEELRSLARWPARYAALGLDENALDILVASALHTLRVWTSELQPLLAQVRANFQAVFHFVGMGQSKFGEAAHEARSAAAADGLPPPRIPWRGLDLPRIADALTHDLFRNRLGVLFPPLPVTAAAPKLNSFAPTAVPLQQQHVATQWAAVVQSWHAWTPSISTAVSASFRFHAYVPISPSPSALAVVCGTAVSVASTSQPSSSIFALFPGAIVSPLSLSTPPISPSFANPQLSKAAGFTADQFMRRLAQLPRHRVPVALLHAVGTKLARGDPGVFAASTSASAVASHSMAPSASADAPRRRKVKKAPSLMDFMRPDTDSDENEDNDDDLDMGLAIDDRHDENTAPVSSAAPAPSKATAAASVSSGSESTSVFLSKVLFFLTFRMLILRDALVRLQSHQKNNCSFDCPRHEHGLIPRTMHSVDHAFTPRTFTHEPTGSSCCTTHHGHGHTRRRDDSRSTFTSACVVDTAHSFARVCRCLQHCARVCICRWPR